MADKEDARVTRARSLGLNEEGINTDPDAGQKQVQAIQDRVDALGYIPADGGNLGFDPLAGSVEDMPAVEELAEGQRQANTQFTMPPDGQAALKPVPPHRDEPIEALGEVPVSDTSGDAASDDVPNKSATREEWDEYARSRGVNPDDYATKEDLQAKFGV